MHFGFIAISPDLHTVSLGVEGPGVVELEDDQGERVSLRHLLVIVQGPHLRSQQYYSTFDIKDVFFVKIG